MDSSILRSRASVPHLLQLASARTELQDDPVLRARVQRGGSRVGQHRPAGDTPGIQARPERDAGAEVVALGAALVPAGTSPNTLDERTCSPLR